MTYLFKKKNHSKILSICHLFLNSISLKNHLLLSTEKDLSTGRGVKVWNETRTHSSQLENLKSLIIPKYQCKIKDWSV